MLWSVLYVPHGKGIPAFRAFDCMLCSLVDMHRNRSTFSVAVNEQGQKEPNKKFIPHLRKAGEETLRHTVRGQIAAPMTTQHVTLYERR